MESVGPEGSVMTVRELITELSKCDLDARVEVEYNFVVDEYTTNIKLLAVLDTDGQIVRILGE